MSAKNLKQNIAFKVGNNNFWVDNSCDKIQMLGIPKKVIGGGR